MLKVTIGRGLIVEEGLPSLFGGDIGALRPIDRVPWWRRGESEVSVDGADFDSDTATDVSIANDVCHDDLAFDARLLVFDAGGNHDIL